MRLSLAIAAAVLCLVAGASLAADKAPAYRNSAEGWNTATGIVIVQPDSSFVSAASPLPVICTSGCSGSGGSGGDASAANQVIQTTALATINATLGAPLQEGGSVTVTGPVSVAGAFYQATQPISGTVGVSGSVAVTGTFFQATQPVSIATAPALVASSAVIGHVIVDTAPTTAVTIASLPSGAVTNAGTFAVQVTSAPTTAVTGTFFQATQPVSGTVTANAGTNLNTSALSLDATTATTNTDLGPPGATACATDNGSCSLNALAQRANQRLTTINTTLGSPIQATGGTVGLVAGSAVIGHVINDASSAVIGHVVADSGSTTAVTQATAANLNAAVVGTGTAGSAAGGILTVQGMASMTKLLVTPDSVALPANQSVNVAQVNGVTALMGNGATGTGSPRVTIASDNTAFTVNAAQSGTWTAQIGNTPNTTAILANPNQLHPSGATMESCSSGNVAAGTTACTLATAVGKTTFIAGFNMSASGATSGLAVNCTLTGTITGTMTFIFTYPTGATVGAVPLTQTFSPPLPASATNTTIVASCPSGGSGAAHAAMNAWGYQE